MEKKIEMYPYLHAQILSFHCIGPPLFQGIHYIQSVKKAVHKSQSRMALLSATKSHFETNIYTMYSTKPSVRLCFDPRYHDELPSCLEAEER